MSVEITIPSPGESVNEVTVGTWLKSDGDWVEQDEAICEIEGSFTVGRILHPSPASPAANRDWNGTATRQMQELGIW